MGDLGSAPLVSSKTGVADIERLPAQNSAGQFVAVTPSAIAGYAQMANGGKLETSDIDIIKGGQLLVSYDTDEGTVTKRVSPADAALLLRVPEVAGQIINQRWYLNYLDDADLGSFKAKALPSNTAALATGVSRTSEGRYVVTVPGWPGGAFDGTGVDAGLPIYVQEQDSVLRFVRLTPDTEGEVELNIYVPGTNAHEDWFGVVEVLIYSPLPVEGVLLLQSGDRLLTQAGDGIAL